MAAIATTEATARLSLVERIDAAERDGRTGAAWGWTTAAVLWFGLAWWVHVPRRFQLVLVVLAVFAAASGLVVGASA